MYTELRSLYEYQVGGSLPLEAPTYVTRQADADLYRGVKAGQFCYVLNSRQTGKSSLRVRTMQRLQAEGMICAVVDLTAIGNQNIPADQWYAGVTYTLASSFNLLDQVDIGTWWCDRQFLPPVQRLSEFIREVLFKKIHQNLAIFVDEIDSVLALDFPINDFFSLIRSCYNNRAEHPEYKRLNWILLGVANPSDLIDSAPNSTLFNIGCAIELTEFKQYQLQPLSQGLVDITPNPDAVIQEVLNWTGGQPFLTQKLCKLILQEAGVRSQELGAFLSGSQSQMPNPKSQIAEWIENLVRSHVLENWEMTDEPEHLRTIRNRLLKSGWRILGLLGLYQEILQQGEVPANDSAEQVELRLSGLVVKQEGKLKVYNRIYQSVFNLSWVEKILANWRHYDSSLIAWEASNRKNKLYFLSGQILQDALAWTTDKSLNDTSTKQLERIFSQFYCLTSLEIEQAKLLLESYHAVYRVQRLKQRQAGIKGQCAPLTTEQLQQIAQRFSHQTSKLLRPETLLAKLHNMASHLRDYRIHVRGGFIPKKPIDVSMAPNSSHATTERLLLHSLIDDRNTIDLETEFLDSYRQQFLACLDHAIADITEQRVRKLQRKDPEKAQEFLTALQLFHGQGKSMGEIAKQVNLNAQFHVSRLLQLKSFRADIQQQFLILLRDRVINTAKVYTDPERLQSLSQQIEEALEEQVTKVIEEAATEASIPTGTKNQTPSTSLFSERLCRYLDRLK